MWKAALVCLSIMTFVMSVIVPHVSGGLAAICHMLLISFSVRSLGQRSPSRTASSMIVVSFAAGGLSRSINLSQNTCEPNAGSDV